MSKTIPLSLFSIILICLSSYISITLPISQQSIPFTAQSLVIFIIAGLLRPGHFMLAILGYLFLGVIGLPVFAEGSSGWNKITGASGGFLYGFAVAGLLVSFMLRSKSSYSFVKILLVMLCGTVVLFSFGLSHLAYKFGWAKALEYGLYPFWGMGLVKAALAAIIVWLIHNRITSRL